MIGHAHDPLLVALSIAVALMAGFTGLTMTRGANELPAPRRKLLVALAAVALGGGIWSMHFVAMLAMDLPRDFYFDVLVTLISALAAILIVGIALLLLHFMERTRKLLLIAGSIIGLGIAIMHYIGMSGIRVYVPHYSVTGVSIAFAASLLLGIGAVAVAYSDRGARNIMLGTVVFGLAVSAMHYIAMMSTTFTLSEVLPEGPIMSTDALAFGVTLAVFVLSAGFLLTSVTFFPVAGHAAAPPEPVVMAATAPEPDRAEQVAEPDPLRLPFEQDGRTHFVASAEIAAIRAEGHYTILYAQDRKLFCPWSLTEADTRLTNRGFVRTHRSYLVNPAHVTSFERTKDSGVCYFAGSEAPGKVPVSRSRLADVRERLGV